MSAYACYYNDHTNDICYWSYSNEHSTTDFAAIVSNMLGRRITASDTSYASGREDLERHQRGMKAIHV